MPNKKPKTKMLLGFKLAKGLMWQSWRYGLASFFIRPRKIIFWYNLSMIVTIMMILGYVAGRVQNHINHHDLLSKGVAEYKVLTTNP